MAALIWKLNHAWSLRAIVVPLAVEVVLLRTLGR